MLMDRGFCGAENLTGVTALEEEAPLGNLGETSSEQWETKSGSKILRLKLSCASPGSAVAITSVTSAKIPHSACFIKVLCRGLY